MFNGNAGEKTIVVLKIGGSVLTCAKAFRRVSRFLKHRMDLGSSEKLVVVVSAQKGQTDALERSALGIVRTPTVRSLDLLWSTAELRSVALLALHLQALRISAVGLNVHETGLLYASNESNQPGPSFVGPHLEAALAEHSVVVVPGFLAAREDAAIVSLGRGGSDLTAVLLAVGLHASRCELLKDVPGYFEDDPHANARAVHLPALSFEDAVAMAQRGCELVQARALVVAAEANLTLVIRSLDERAPITVVSAGGSSAAQECVPREPLKHCS